MKGIARQRRIAASIPWALAAIAAAGALAYALRDLNIAFEGRPYREAFEYWIFNAVFYVAAAACAARAILVRRDRGAWLAIAASLFIWATGEAYWALVVDKLHPEPYPSGADAFWIASYIPYYVGVILFIRARVTRRDAAMWLDGGVAAAAAAAVGAALLAPALIDLTMGDPAAVATNLAYPVGDVLLLAFVIGAGGLLRMRAQNELALVAVALLLLATADGAYLYGVATGTYGNVPIDWLWPFSAAALAMAAAWSTKPRPAEATERRAPTLVVPVVSALVALGLLLAAVWRPIPDVASALAAVALALVVARLMLTLRENRALLTIVHLDSVTDPLTGLSNRRQLVNDLDAYFAADGVRVGVGDGRVFAMFDLDGFKNYNDTFGHAAGDILLRRLGERLRANTAPYGTAYRLGGDEFCILVSEEGAAKALAAASAALSAQGDGFQISSSRGVVSLPEDAGDPSLALGLADTRMYAQKRGRGHSAALQARNVLMSTFKEREPELDHHLRGVATYAGQIGRAMGLASEDLDVLTRAAELHDVGKLAIPDEILYRPGPLTDSEWELVRKHTLIGERILGSAPAMLPVARLVRSSHERYDGDGYPDKLASEEIPLGSRIIFVCDAFEAMTADRPYSAAMSVEDAIAELRRNAGTQFDPDVVELFAQTVTEVLPELEPVDRTASEGTQTAPGGPPQLDLSA